MKKISFSLLMMLIVCSAFATSPVNEKVLNVFSTAFPKVQNVRWYEYKDYYEVLFDQDDLKCRVQYNAEGQVIRSRRDYYGKDLCPFLKAKIAQKYPGKNVYGVTEITTDEEISYDIILEDEKTWMYIKSDAVGQMSTANKFNKAQP
ncbi:MAG: hypothetical protein M3Y85_08900 [Bacteroidota bacterium]|nr:hypothetical protein [Bacteroidota bacterium]